VTHRQLIDAGMSMSAIRHARRKRRLFLKYPGVYAVGRRDLTREGRWMAAVLACGDGAALSHVPAGLLWKILERGDERPHVTVPRHRTGPAGVLTHQARVATEKRLRIPVTCLIQTLIDLAGDLEPDALKAAVREAVRIHALDVRTLNAAVAEPRTDWRKARLRTVCDLWVPNIELTQSELEARFYELVARHGLPLPELQRPFGRYRSDFIWPAARLVVETDGRDHLTPAARQADAARDRAFAAAGYVVLRFMWADVVNRPAEVIRDVSRWFGCGSARS
jgi:very-short-patch-repair endonuclease